LLIRSFGHARLWLDNQVEPTLLRLEHVFSILRQGIRRGEDRTLVHDYGDQKPRSRLSQLLG
jgi:hypothetical protein